MWPDHYLNTLRLFILAILAALFMCPAANSADAVPHYYPFETGENGITPDEWGDADGLLVNGAGIINCPLNSPDPDNELFLDGVDDYVALPSDFSFDYLGNIFIIDVDVIIQFQNTDIQTIIANTEPTVNKNGFKLFVNSFAHPGDWTVCFESGNGSSGTQVCTDDYVFIYDTWNHIKVIADADDFWVQIFVNYQLEAEGPTAVGFNLVGDTDIGRMRPGEFTDLLNLGGCMDNLVIVPEPSSISLLALSALSLRRRRKP